VPELTDEHIEDLFADLRADEIRQVRPPGTAAARGTVKRRRTVRSVTAGVAALAVVGGIAVGLNDRGPSSDLIGTDTHRVYSDALLEIRRDLAATVVGVPAEVQGIVGREMLRGGTTSVFEALAGTYELKLSCVGAGQVDVEVRNGAAGAGGVFDHEEAAVALRTPATCDGPGSIQAWTFPITEDFLAVSVQPDREARDQSAFAFAAALSPPDRKRYQDIAADAVDALGGSEGSSLASFLSDGTSRRVYDDTEVRGQHRLHAACTGLGSVTFTVSATSPIIDGEQADGPPAKVLARRTLACGSTAVTATLTFTGTGSGALETRVTPDADAAGRAAAAYRLVSD
jgi:hypothetical protein